MIKNRSERAAFDFYQTSPTAVKELLAREHLPFPMWEPACGKGDITRVLESYRDRLTTCRSLRGDTEIRSSDIQTEPWIWGDKGVDFLAQKPTKPWGTIITNPPYLLAREFIEKALSLKPRRVAMLLRLGFLESVERFRLFEETPPCRVYVFSRRMPFEKDGVWTKTGGQFAHAWFVWNLNTNTRSPTELHWINVDNYELPEVV